MRGGSNVMGGCCHVESWFVSCPLYITKNCKNGRINHQNEKGQLECNEWIKQFHETYER